MVVKAAQGAKLSFETNVYFGMISQNTQSLDLEFDLKGQMPSQSRLLLETISALVLTQFWDNIRYPFDFEFDPENDLENYNEGHFRVQRPKLYPGTRFGVNLNSSPNMALITSLT